MATVFKRPGSPFWFACYADQIGKTVRRTTKSAAKPTAIRMALEWEQLERASKEGQVTMATFQKVVSDISIRAIGDAVASLTTREYLTDWLVSIRKKTTLGTQVRYEATVRQFLKALDHMADQPLRGLTPRHIELFLNTRLDGGAAPKTAIVDIKTLGIALRRAERYGFIDKNPVPAVRLPKCVSSERDVFTMDEIGKLVNAAPQPGLEDSDLSGRFHGRPLGRLHRSDLGEHRCEQRNDQLRSEKNREECDFARSPRSPAASAYAIGIRNPRAVMPFPGKNEKIREPRVVRRIQTHRRARWLGSQSREREGNQELRPQDFPLLAAHLQFRFGQPRCFRRNAYENDGAFLQRNAPALQPSRQSSAAESDGLDAEHRKALTQVRQLEESEKIRTL